MKKTNLLTIIFLSLLLLNSCSSVVEGLGGTKKKGSDEFLVEKKSPLVLPPSFGKLPEQGVKILNNVKSNKKNTSRIEKIINQSSSKNTTNKNSDLNNSIEKSIIEKINEQ